MLRAYVWFYVIVLFGPLLLIVLFSFHSSPAQTFPIQGFSLVWYQAFFADHVLVQSLKNSLIVAACSASLTTVLGSMAALALARLQGWKKNLFGILTFAPVALPGLFIGVALLVLFAQFGISRSLVTVALAHTLISLPFFLEASRSRLDYFDLSLEEAARDLGATPWQSFRLVTLPIVAPTLIGAAILSFAISFDEVIVTIFTSGERTTLPIAIWSMMRQVMTPAINAASVLALSCVVLVIASFGLLGWVRRRWSLGQRHSAGLDA
ncbi:MAG: ABC transporter permease [Alphaproteobacteria bacterium]|nr:ABC transporter permease [Alphaproteobacteria bacterium]